MRKLIVVLGLILLTGCSNKNIILGTFKTNYEISSIGNVVEKYEFKEKGKCVRTIITTTEINTDCTYEFNKNKSKIKINWEDKIYKDEFSDYEEIDKNNIKIGNYTYIREELKK